MIRLLAKLFISAAVICSLSVAAQICPTSGKITILCHQHPGTNGLSLTGCYNGGLSYLCTSQLTSCQGVNNNSIETVRWTLPVYDAHKMRFTCPSQGKASIAQHIALSAATWKNVAAKATAQNPKQICPAKNLPVLCNKQSTGVSLIGCHGGGLAYLCTTTIASCNLVNNQTVSKAQWARANYNDVKLIFACPGTHKTDGHSRVKLHTGTWDTAVKNAQ